MSSSICWRRGNDTIHLSAFEEVAGAESRDGSQFCGRSVLRDAFSSSNRLSKSTWWRGVISESHKLPIATCKSTKVFWRKLGLVWVDGWCVDASIKIARQFALVGVCHGVRVAR